MKALHIIASALIAVTVTSCGGGGKASLTHMPAKAEGEKHWGMIDANGKFLFTDEFKNCPSPVIDGYFTVREDDGISVYSAEEKPKQVGELFNLKYAGFFSEGLIPVTSPDERIRFVDTDGETQFIIEPIDSVEILKCSPMFVNGLCAVCTNDGKWGAIDSSGDVVIQPTLDSEPLFIEDFSIATIDDEYYIINKKGEKVHQFDEKEFNPRANYFVNGRSIGIVDDEQYGFIDTKGNITKFPSSVDRIREWGKDYICYENDDKYGIMNYEGEVILRPTYERMVMLPDGTFLAKKNNDRIYHVTPDGEEVRLPNKDIELAIEYPIINDLIFNFEFKLVNRDEDDDDDDEWYLCNYIGEEMGEAINRLDNEVELDYIYSDYVDVDGIMAEVKQLFDESGVKGYPFNSVMGNYADPSRSTRWYNYDRQISVPNNIFTGKFFTAAINLQSDNYVVNSSYNPNYYSYDYTFNDQSRVNAITLTLEFLNSSDCRENVAKKIAEYLSTLYSSNIEVADGYSTSSDNYVTYGYSEIQIHLCDDLNNIAKVEEVVEVVDSVEVSVDTVAVAL